MMEAHMTFEPGPANPQQFTAGMSLVPGYDPIDLLPPAAADRLRMLRQRAADGHALCVPFEDVRLQSAAKVEAEHALKRLTSPPAGSWLRLAVDRQPRRRRREASREGYGRSAAAAGAQRNSGAGTD
jgi:hypothetical protein